MTLFDDSRSKRKPFTLSQRKVEWIDAAGKDVMEYIRDRKFTVKTSYCRRCKTKLTWGDGTYNFDHKDNNPANNSQRNCFLVCRNCHGKVTKIGKRAIRGIFGDVVGYKTIKRKVGYKKPKTSTKTAKTTSSRKVKSSTKSKSRRTGSRTGSRRVRSS